MYLTRIAFIPGDKAIACSNSDKRGPADGGLLVSASKVRAKMLWHKADATHNKQSDAVHCKHTGSLRCVKTGWAMLPVRSSTCTT